jgi:hypothetical protein
VNSRDDIPAAEHRRQHLEVVPVGVVQRPARNADDDVRLIRLLS